MFQSGNIEHPSDRFYNTTVEIVPELQNHELLKRYKTTPDGYAIVGKSRRLCLILISLEPETIRNWYGYVSSGSELLSMSALQTTGLAPFSESLESGTYCRPLLSLYGPTSSN